MTHPTECGCEDGDLLRADEGHGEDFADGNETGRLDERCHATMHAVGLVDLGYARHHRVLECVWIGGRVPD